MPSVCVSQRENRGRNASENTQCRLARLPYHEYLALARETERLLQHRSLTGTGKVTYLGSRGPRQTDALLSCFVERMRD